MRFVAITFMILASISAAEAQMTHEETLVRTAYATFAYAVQQETIGKLALEADNRGIPNREPSLTSAQRLAARQVDFTLSDFVIGDVQDIVNRKATDLISPAVDEKLETTTSTISYSDQGLNTGWQSLLLHWEPASALPAEAQDITLVQLYELQWHEQ